MGTDHRGLGKGLVNPLAAFADIKFEVEKQQVNGHSVIVNHRCPELIAPKASKKKPAKKKGVMQIVVPPNIDHNTLLEVLNFTYTGEIEFPKLTVPSILKLNAAAIDLELGRLRWLCENYLRSNLSLENIFQVLKGAHEHKQRSVKEFCFHYVLKNYTDFVGNKEGVKDLGIDLFQEVVEVYQQSLAGEVKAPPIPTEPEDSLVEDYQQIYEEMKEADVTFKVGEDFIPCHRAILASYSTELTELCSRPVQTAGKGKDAVEHIVLPGIKAKSKEGPVLSSKAFHAFLRYAYYADVAIEATYAVELIAFSKDFNLPELQNICIDIARKNVNKETALQILAITYLQQMEENKDVAKELKTKSIEFILSNLDEVDLKPLRKMNPNIAIDVLIARQSKGKVGAKPEQKKEPKGEGKKAEVKKEAVKEESSSEEESSEEESDD